MDLRLSAVFSIFDRSGYNNENSTLSTIEQNLRSHASYVGTVSSRRFVWEETIDDTDLRDGSMVKLRKQKSTSTSAIIIDYDKFTELYNIDFRRTFIEGTEPAEEQEKSPAAPSTPTEQAFPFPPIQDSAEPF